MEFLSYPFEPAFGRFLEAIEDPCIICSPFVSSRPMSRVIDAIRRKRIEGTIRLTLVTDIAIEHLVAASTDLRALQALSDNVARATLVYLPRVHAKIYASGTAMAIVTSANLTEAGLSKNFEYGVATSDPVQVSRVRADAERYAELGGRLSPEHLEHIGAYVADLREALDQEQRSVSEEIRRATRDLQRRAEDQLLRARVAGRSITGVFADTILYVLEAGPMSTQAIHTRVQAIHPDLCDDGLDRVIDGERFGKLWKHHVRNAQQQLRRDGLIELDRGRGTWRRVARRT